MLTQDLPYWVAWSRSPKIGPRRLALLRRAFPDMQSAWRAPLQQLKQIGFEDNLCLELNDHRLKTDVEKSWLDVQNNHLQVTTIESPDYPALLKEIGDPPAILFWRGDWSAFKFPSLAVVGSRQMTDYGRQALASIVPPLARSGITIISGLAFGIDAASHKLTIDNGGRTIAVLASGHDQLYPSVNRYLSDQIASKGGLIISEHPPGTPPLKHHFPVRNRIIAGLAKATLVVEAAASSGALITAKLALEYNREVLAIPGNIFSPQSEGTNELLRIGAVIVTKASDILSIYNVSEKPAVAFRTLDMQEQGIINSIKTDPKHSDEIARELNIPAGDLISKLTILELEGFIKEIDKQKFISLV